MRIIIRQAKIKNTQNRILIFKEDRIIIYPKGSDKYKFNIVFKTLINVDVNWLTKTEIQYQNEIKKWENKYL